MRSGITKRGTRLVQNLATAQMFQTCAIERLAAATYDTDTLVAVPGTRSTIYTGRCRVWEQENPSAVSMVGTDFLSYQTILSLPWDTSAEVRLMDEMELTGSPTDALWVGARFRVQNAKFGGNLRATRSFVLERLTPRP